MSSDTPRTDSVASNGASSWDQSGLVRMTDHARQLERELAAVTAELANIKNLQRIGNQIFDAESGG